MDKQEDDKNDKESPCLKRIREENQKTPSILNRRQSLQAFIEATAPRHQHVTVGMHLPTLRNEESPLEVERGNHDKIDRKTAEVDREPETEILSPQRQVQFLLSGEANEAGDDEDRCWIKANSGLPRLFTEMEELHMDDNGQPFWKETTRWIKFEESVEEGGDRWSKPHVATLSLQSLLELRSCLMNGVVELNMDADSLDQIADIVLDVMVSQDHLPNDGTLRERVKGAILSGHEHQSERANVGLNIKSVADMMTTRKEPSVAFGALTSMGLAGTYLGSPIIMERLKKQTGKGHSSGNPHPSATKTLLSETTESCDSTAVHEDSGPSNSQTDGTCFLNLPSTETEAELLPNPGAHSNSAEGNLHGKQRGTAIGFLPKEFSPAADLDKKEKKVPHLMKKIPEGSEASNVLVGEMDFLDRPIVAFVRLQDSALFEGITEVPISTRFLFILMGPLGNKKRYHEIGRSIGTLMADEVFHVVAYKARTKYDLLAGIDEFLGQVTVLPPGEWDSKIRIEPPQDLPENQMTRLQPKNTDSLLENGNPKLKSSHGVNPELHRTGRIFGGLIADVRRKAPFYLSDYRDALNLQCVASFIFLYFAVLTPVVTFGGLLGDATHNSLGAMEGIFGAAMAGTAFHLFSGQPLTIVGITGPLLVFEEIMFEICQSADLEYLSFRWWVGTWTGIFCIVLVATDASSLIRYITRYTEESFSALTSLIFIYEAFKKLVYITYDLRIWHGWNADSIPQYECNCLPPNITGLNITHNLDYKNISIKSKEMALQSLGDSKGTLYLTGNSSYTCSFDGENYNVSDINDVVWRDLSKSQCITMNCGELDGDSCEYTPDAMLMSVILFFGTFALSWFLKGLKSSRFFPTKVRSVISDFSVTIAIAIMVVFDLLMNLSTPKLLVPDTFRPTRSDRGWFISPLGKNQWWSILAAIGPALICTVLIFMVQQITGVIINRKENKLKKGGGYHLDLFVVAIMMIISSMFGLPWFVAATVLSITNVNSLKMESESSAPGEAPKFLGVREQRASGIIIFLLIGLSVLMTPVLAYIPMPILYGVFLYMGVSSLRGVQFIDRCKLFFMPPKHQPDLVYLRHVPLRTVYLFTFIQLVGLIFLWVIKSIKPVSIIFPIMVAALIPLRKIFDCCIFEQEDLFWLDDIMPESTKKKKDDKKKQQDKDLIPSTINISTKDGNVLKIPISEIQYNSDDPTSINITNEMTQTTIWKTIVRNKMGYGTGLKKEERWNNNNTRANHEEALDQEEKYSSLPNYSSPSDGTESPPQNPSFNFDGKHELGVIAEAKETDGDKLMTIAVKNADELKIEGV